MAPVDKYPPLVTARSPSYQRARDELAKPSPPGDAAVVALVGRLVEAEHEAARATRAAGLADAAAEHGARAQALGELISALGGSAPRPEESRDILTHGADAVARGPDPVAELRAMREELDALYADAARDPQLTAEQRRAIEALAPG